jgi:hypothetical protein
MKKMKYHTLGAIITFILLPPFWVLSVPAIIFSSEAKKFDKMGASILAQEFSEKARKFVVSSWLIFIILVAAALSIMILSSVL